MAVLYFILPSLPSLPLLPLLLIMPWAIRAGMSFWVAMGIGVGVTLALYAGFFWLARRVGILL